MRAPAKIALADLMIGSGRMVDPSRFSREEFELFSIPAFDRGAPDQVLGHEIGSSKQLVQAGDVLLSKIVPHIRRAWVVRSHSHKRLLASSEWMGFRSSAFDPEFMRHLLVSDRFHAQMMGTVAGVGGSLLRARPALIAAIVVTLPPIDEQRSIARALDDTNAVRAKRQAAMRHLGSLTSAALEQMFGTVETNEHELPIKELGDVCIRVTDGTHQSPAWADSGIPFLFVRNIVGGEIDWNVDKHVSAETHATLTARCPIEKGDVLYSTVGSYGVPVVVRTNRRFAFQRHIAHLKPKLDEIEPEYLRAALASPSVRRQADRVARGVAQKTLNLADISKFRLIVPSLAEQARFSAIVGQVASCCETGRRHLTHLDALMVSLQQRAFAGAV